MIEATLALRLLAACGAIVCVLVALRTFGQATLRAAGKGGRPRSLALLETLHLPNAASLHIIRAGERLVVVGRSGTHIAAICELGPAGGGGPPSARREA